MARSCLVFLAACLCLAAAGTSATGRTRSSSFHHRSSSFHHCTTAHRSSSRSYHGAGCPKGHPRKRGRRSHALFFRARNGRCPDATLAPSPHDVAQVRAATLCLVNRERARHRERPLYWNDRLIFAAQLHTESMAFGSYFAHAGSHGDTPLTRVRRAGYIYSSRLGFEVGENIGWGSLWLASPRAIVAAWMASPGHRANILDGRFRDTGIGVSAHLGSLARGQSGGIYTQDFGVIVGA